MSIITKEQLESLQPNTRITGVILLKSYNIQLTKNGVQYVAGSLMSGVDISFKAWNRSSAFAYLHDKDLSNTPINIVGTIDDYGGNISIVLDSAEPVEGFTPDQFMLVKYDMQAYWKALQQMVGNQVTKKAYALADKILFSNTELSKRFCEEFAAKSHHDNCKSGLLVHTYKVVSNMIFILGQYSHLIEDNDKYDLAILGALLHDIGKVKEMEFGVYNTESSYVGHTFFGVELLAPFKADIIGAYGEEGYLELVSVMLQHHDEYETPSKTLTAYLVYRADELDAKMTLIQQTIEKKSADSKDNTIRVDGRYFAL